MKAIRNLEINRETIALLASEKEEENDAFRDYLNHSDGDKVDGLVHRLNEQITPLIDCTVCGACCRGLMINVVEPEIEPLATHLDISAEDFKEKFIEQGIGGQMIMNTIPCNFLSDSKCTVYEKRFTECREFPHLHKSNFKGRLFGTMVHYAMCPIIFNVVEELKVEMGFKEG